MLETLDPANRLPAAPDDRGRQARELVAGPRRAAGPAAMEATLVDRGARDGPGAQAEATPAATTPWSSDWLQLSHELRTPLNAILGNIELLLDGSAGPLAAPVRACVGDIQMASRQLLRQLQPLLLLVQARTAGALVSDLPIDLLALLRQAAADSSPAPDRCALQERARRGGPRLPEDTCLMITGDPVWLGALAAALVDLHAGSAAAPAPLSVALEQPGEQPGEPPGEQAPRQPGERAGEQPGVGADRVVLRASWPGDPAALSPLPLALIDAVLALHGGRIRSLSTDGLRLDLASATVVRRSVAARGRR